MDRLLIDDQRKTSKVQATKEYPEVGMKTVHAGKH
jgi:hypothetical protein